MKSASVPKPRFWIKAKSDRVCLYLKFYRRSSMYRPASADIGKPLLRAPFLPQAAIIAAACRAKRRNAEAFCR
jgi:hypothetical protein